MRRWILPLLLLSFLTIPADAQQLLSRVAAAGQPFLVLDPQTGATTTIGPVVNPSIDNPVLAAFDAQHQRLYFVTAAGTLAYLDLATSSIVTVPGSIGFPVAIEYDSQTNRIIAAGFGFPISVRAIDPVTGVSTPIASVSTTGIAVGISAIDVTGRRLFLETGAGFPKELQTINLSTGVVTTAPLTAGAQFFEYDATSNRIISVIGSIPPQIIAIDPATGSYNVLFNAPSSVGSPHTAASSFDPLTRRLYFLSTDPSVFPFRRLINTADLNTQSVTSTPISGGAILSFLALAAPQPAPTLAPALLVLLAIALTVVALRPR